MPDDTVDSQALTGESQHLPASGGALSVDRLLKVVALTFGYCLTGGLGLSVAIPPGYATAVWPPSGIALAAVLLWGPRVWPGIWLGSFLLNVWVAWSANADFSATNLGIAASIGVGSTLQALLGAFLLKRWVGVGRLFESGPAVLALCGHRDAVLRAGPHLGRHDSASRGRSWTLRAILTHGGRGGWGT